MSVYFTSDLHLGHKNVHMYRKRFSSAEEHDKFMLDMLASTLTKRDKIYLLGDNCFTEEAFYELASVIPSGCEVTYIAGNHDFERSLTPKIITDFGFKLIGIEKYKRYWLTHAPIHPCELRDKINIHGHTHETLLGDGYLNVCPEVCNYSLVQLERIPEFMAMQMEMFEQRENPK